MLQQHSTSLKKKDTEKRKKVGNSDNVIVSNFEGKEEEDEEKEAKEEEENRELEDKNDNNNNSTSTKSIK